MLASKIRAMRPTRTAGVAAALVAALGLAACGSSNTADTSGSGPATVTKTQTVTVSTSGATGTSPSTTTATTSTPTSSTTTTGPTTTTVTSTSTTATGTTTSGGSGLTGDHCVASELTPVSKSANGAAGTIIWEVALKNTSSANCATEGYPGVQFLDSSGNPVGHPATRTTTTMAGGTVQPSPITLRPGDSAYFYVQVNDAAGGGAGCSNVSYLQIYAPDDSTAMRLTASQEIQYCPKLTVTPLQASPGSQ
jgi:hypothetical protein